MRWPAPNRDRFARRVIHALRAYGVTESLDYDPTEFQLRFGDGRWMNLGNVYADCSLLPPWQRSRAIDRFVRSLTVEAPPEPASFDDARPLLLPGVRHVATLDYLELSTRLDAGGGSREDIDLAWEPFSPDLFVCLCVDAPNGMLLINKGVLTRWGVGFDEALALAKDNLRARTPTGLQEAGPGRYVSAYGDCYDGARLLLPELLRDLDLEGEPVAIHPNWTTLFVVGSRDHQGLAAGLRACVDGLQAAKAMTAQPLIYRYPRWEPLAIPRGHAAHHEWLRARAYERMGSYEEQKRLIEAYHEREGTDVFVASYTATEEKASGRVSSYCMWGKTVVSLLPETDRVVFFDPGQPEEHQLLAQIDWDIVTTHCAALMVRTEHRLPRFHVERFPEPAVLEAMRSAQALRQ